MESFVLELMEFYDDKTTKNKNIRAEVQVDMGIQKFKAD